MKSILISLALFAGQAVHMQEKPVVRLKPHTAGIEAQWGGSLLELSQAPAAIYLPMTPPRPDVAGHRWTIDVKNFGPLPVTVQGKGGFSVPVAVNQTIHIVSNGAAYSLQY